MTGQEKAAALERRAPELRDRDLEQINELFRAFLFKNAGGEVWTTCCRRHEVIGEESGNAREIRVLYAPHTPEMRGAWDRSSAWKRRERCPWCGAEVTVKELGYCGQRKNLSGYRRAVVLRRWRGAVWALAYDCFKDYYGKEQVTGAPRLTELPRVKLLSVYRFTPGKVESARRTSWWSEGAMTEYAEQTRPGKGRHMWRIHAPYGYDPHELGNGYDVIGYEELAGTWMAYCGMEKAVVGRKIELLTAACFYPRQIEWLMKLRLSEAVRDLAERGVKNAAAICWDAERPKEFLGCTVREFEALREAAGVYPVEALELYRKGYGAPAECGRLAQHLHDRQVRQAVLSRMRRYGVGAKKMADYLDAVKERNKRADPARAYVDYLRAAEGCGIELKNPIHLMPRDFWAKHDSVTAAWSAMEENKRNAAENQAYRERLRALTKKYLYWDETYLIRAPVTVGEIAAEGRALQHCVGGYARRHLKGETVILFLRRRDRPHRPLVTIEMDGNKLIQIHGYKNEYLPCEDNPERKEARELYREIVDPWLKWLAGGSRREKDGRPKQTGQRKRKETAA